MCNRFHHPTPSLISTSTSPRVYNHTQCRSPSLPATPTVSCACSRARALFSSRLRPKDDLEHQLASRVALPLACSVKRCPGRARMTRSHLPRISRLKRRQSQVVLSADPRVVDTLGQCHRLPRECHRRPRFQSRRCKRFEAFVTLSMDTLSSPRYTPLGSDLVLYSLLTDPRG